MESGRESMAPDPVKHAEVPRVPARTASAALLSAGMILGLALLLAVVLLIDLIGMPCMALPLPALVAMGAFTLPFVLYAVTKHAGRWQARVICLAVALLVVVLVLPWHARKLFVYRLMRVEAGMTIDEVDEILDGYMKGPRFPPAQAYTTSGSPQSGGRVGASGTMTYRWNDAAGNADSGRVRYVDGRVTTVVFLPD